MSTASKRIITEYFHDFAAYALPFKKKIWLSAVVFNIMPFIHIQIPHSRKKKRKRPLSADFNLENLPAGTLGWLKLKTLSSSSISGTTQSSLVDVLPFFLVGDGMSGETDK